MKYLDEKSYAISFQDGRDYLGTLANRVAIVLEWVKSSDIDMKLLFLMEEDDLIFPLRVVVENEFNVFVFTHEHISNCVVNVPLVDTFQEHLL